jgi:hypothetical protein
MNTIRTFLPFLLFVFGSIHLVGQHFSFITEAGYLKSQVDGDKIHGFYKSGFQLGIGTKYGFTDVSSFLIKTSFYQQGSARKDRFQDKLEDGIQLELTLKSIGLEASYQYDHPGKSFFLGGGLVQHRIISFNSEIIENDVKNGLQSLDEDLISNYFTDLKVYYGSKFLDDLSFYFYFELSLTNILKSEFENLARLTPYSFGVNLSYEIKSGKSKRRRR